jgi:pimeloyl-ACP methyl ester carboxylesterase
VIPLLQEAGMDVVAVQNPTTSLADDAAATRRTLNAIQKPIVLVGHSWGGTVITEAGHDPKVKALVYLAAFAPDVGQSTGDQVAAHDSPPGLGNVEDRGDGTLMMSVSGWVNDVAQDLPEDEAQILAAVQTPLGAGTFGDKVTQAAWLTRPNWYVISSDDRAVSVDLQRKLAAKLHAETTTLKASHMSLLSMPQEVAKVIGDAVAAIAASTDASTPPIPAR